ncbi:MAG TPA: VTT domain-containing protein [Gemmatimonas sp.]|nr:VTT domain-containing protein [Gemmatimonas sp.]
MTDMLDWLAAQPWPLLYGAILLAAFAENVFPPLPADTVVALGAFVAARGNGTAFGAWAATMVGNIGGAMLMYWLGRRFGMPWLMRRFPRMFTPDSTAAVTERFRKGGIVAVGISRFLPGVRAIVPPIAGAIGFGAVRAAVAMTVASGLWYGMVCWLAFRAGANADVLLARIAGQQRTVALVTAGVVAVIVLAVVVIRRRRVR